MCRRGYFIEGMGGAQFALPGAVERLRAARTGAGERSRALVIAAADPAQPYGAALPWPKRDGQERRPARVAGAYVVMVDDEPVLYVERGGRGLVTLARRDGGGSPLARAALAEAARRAVHEALGALAEAVRAGRVPKLALERIDGEPAIASELAEVARRARLPVGSAQAHAHRLRGSARLSAIVGAAMIEHSLTPPRRVGHKGAAHIEPGNTLASFDAALRHGVDMIELDVLSEHADGSGRLLVAHDYDDMRVRTPLSFAEALEHLAGEEFAGIELDVDVKLPGYELRVLAALRDLGLVERTLISGMFPASLARIRAAEPALRLGWSVPRVRRDYTTDLLTAIPALAMLSGYRAMLPRRVRAALAGRALRRDHGPLARGHRRARARGRRMAAASCTYGRSTTRP